MAQHTTYQEGDIISYPTEDHNFYTLTGLPESVVSKWVMHLHDEGTRMKNPATEDWLNKTAIVIRSSYGETLAIYKHDFEWYLIRERDSK